MDTTANLPVKSVSTSEITMTSLLLWCCSLAALASTATLKIFVSGRPPICTGKVLAELTEVEDAFRLLQPDEAIDLASSGVRQKNSSSIEEESPRGPPAWWLAEGGPEPGYLHDDLRVILLTLWLAWCPLMMLHPPSGEREEKKFQINLCLCFSFFVENNKCHFTFVMHSLFSSEFCLVG